jgi:NAD(P)-dependent dehydrogenase (short-subunit alcohol dehydrogenase family)
VVLFQKVRDSHAIKIKISLVKGLSLLAAIMAISLTATLGSIEPSLASTVLITGSSRGIGFEFARQYADKGWTVIATCRNPAGADALNALASKHPNLIIEQLDVTDHGMIDALAEKYQDTPIDVLLNNAGINPGQDTQTFGAIDYDVYHRIIATNTTGPLKISEAFVDHVAASKHKKIMTLTSGLGSLNAAERFPGILAPYRISKAGVNMAMLVISRAVKGRGIVVGTLEPGIVDTDQAAGMNVPKMPPEEAIAAMIIVIENFDADTSGLIYRYTGERAAW